MRDAGMNTPTSADRARQLFDEGAAALALRWDDDVAMVRYSEHADYHDPRGTLGYAGVLLREPNAANVEKAERAIRAVLAVQERREQDAHHGNFRWMLEDEGVTDLNGVEFMLDGLNFIIREYSAVLSAAITEEIREAIALGLAEIDRLDVHPSYTNIALSDVCNSILGGETIGDERAVERGARRLDEWFDFTNESGAPHEYNSPTYLAVDIARMAYLVEQTADMDIALKARIAEERLWLHVAAHYHQGLAQLAGPHSRSYFDGWTGAGGLLKLMLWRLLGDDALRPDTPYAARSREEGHVGVAREVPHIPPYVERLLSQKSFPYGCDETTHTERESDITTFMTESYALGTASRSYGVGDPPEPWPGPNNVLLQFKRDAAPGYGSLFARYVVNDRGLGAYPNESGRTAEDWWEEGTFVGAQHRNRAIVAYGLVPRLRPAHSYKLSVNMLGVAGADLRIGKNAIDAAGSDPSVVAPGEAVCVAAGDVYIAIVPLQPTDMGSDAPIELRIDGERLSLDIYNYRGPAKTFWEHRSQSGPFYRGNVRNAFVLEIAERSEYADIDAFAAHIADATIADGLDDEYVREIAYASDGGSITLRYSIWDMSPVGRRFDGVPYVAQMGRAGAVDGSGAQFVQSRDTLLQLGRAKLLAGSTPKWLIADEDASMYVFVNPSTEEAPVWFQTPRTAVECEAFGFGRIQIDDAANAIAIEATGEIGPVRVRLLEEATLSVNGIDVTPMLLRTTEEGVREFRGL
jgi:hypothetical protein